MQEPDLLTTAEAAARLGVSTKTIYRRVQAGSLVPVRKLDGIRGAYLFDPATIGATKDRSAA